MAEIDLTKIVELNEHTTPAQTDWLVIRDNASGHTKKALVRNVLKARTNDLKFVVSADGTGDYATIQQALDAVPSGGAEIEVQPGYYYITAGLVIKKAGTVLRGYGLNTQVEVSGPSITDAVSMATDSMEGIEIRGFYFIRTNTVGTGTCLNFSDTPLAKVENIRADDFDIGLEIIDTVNVSFYSSYANCAFVCNSGIVMGGNPVNDNYFLNFRIRCLSGGGGTGIDLQVGNGNTFVHMNCEPTSPTGVTGLSVGAATFSNTFVGLYAEGNDLGVSIAEGSTNTVLLGGEVTVNTEDIQDDGTSTWFMGVALTSGYINQLGDPGAATDNSDTMADILTHIPTTLGTGTNQNYRTPTDTEIKAIVKGLTLIAQEAGKVYAFVDLTNATSILSLYGFTVTKGYDSVSKRPFALVQAEFTYPASSNYRAWGNYWFDLSRPISLVIEAPHPQTDGNSEYIALRDWQNVPGAMYAMSSTNRKAKDYMLTEISTDASGGTFTLTFRSQTTAAIAYNASPATVQAALEALSSVQAGNVVATGDNVNTSLHCFANLKGSLYSSGSPTDTITGDGTSLTGGTLTIEHDADVAHNYYSIFNQVASSFAAQGYAQLQLHGFADVSSGVPRIFNAILSRGSSNNTKLIEVVRSALEANGFDVGTKDSFATQGLYVTGGPTGGTITLTYNSVATAAITYSATPATFAANVQSALEAHPNIGTGNVAVTLSSNNNTGVSAALVITFKGALYHQGLTAITVSSNALTGGTSPAASGLTAEGTALTAQSNTQGDLAESNGTPFMHLELSNTVRSSTTLSARLVAALANTNLPQLSAAAMPVMAEAGHSTSQAPLVNGSGATIGTSNVAARSDHRHPATTNTPSASQVIARNVGNTAWNAVDPNDIGTNMTNVIHTTGDETRTGILTHTTNTSGNGPQIYRASSTTGQEAVIAAGRVSATPNNTSNMAEITAVRTDSPSSQDTAMVFKNRRSGAAASEVGRFETDASFRTIGTIMPVQATTLGAPTYVKGAIYFDTTLNKLRVGGATGWETITSA